MINLEGDWIGFYEYGEGYSEANKLVKVPFVMTVENAVDEFIGKIKEDKTSEGVEDLILVRGKLDNDLINFVKFYTKAHYIHEDNMIDSLDSDTLSKVYYTGQFIFDEKKFIGEWYIQDYFVDDSGVLHDKYLKGSWEMQKQ